MIFTQDVYIFLYPIRHSIYSRRLCDRNLLNGQDTHITAYLEVGKVMFMGDFNAKTSNKDDVFANDNQRQFTKLDV